MCTNPRPRADRPAVTWSHASTARLEDRHAWNPKGLLLQRKGEQQVHSFDRHRRPQIHVVRRRPATAADKVQDRPTASFW